MDATAGTGGHSAAVLNHLSSKGRLIALDRDPEAVFFVKGRLGSHGNRFLVLQANYADAHMVLQSIGVQHLDGILLDLGMSSFQLEGSKRGFSFQRDEPLDMRMDPDQGIPASELVNRLPVDELARMLTNFGEERRARSIARAIARQRVTKPITTSSQLAALIQSLSPWPPRKKTTHPATRTFQALRIAVNQELEYLDAFLNRVPTLIRGGGRLVVLSYHSLEDRRIKEAMAGWEGACACPRDFPRCVCQKQALFRRLFKKGIRPGEEEIRMNPRSRSAILRAAERTGS